MHGGSRITTAILIGILALLALFGWRVFYYFRGIQSGTLETDDLSFLSDFTFSQRAAVSEIPKGEFELVTADDPSLGSPAAKITIIEFGDFGCPFCRRSAPIMRALAAKYGDHIFFQYRDFPVLELHPDAALAAEASECAHEQGKFWEYHDKLYQNQSSHKERDLLTYAEQLNLNLSAFEPCLTSHRYAKEVEEDYQAGLAAGVQGTPTFFVNGYRIPGSIPEETFDRMIRGLLEP
jgi:protein-disulfide isomerase